MSYNRRNDYDFVSFIWGILIFYYIGTKIEDAYFLHTNGFIFWILFILCLFILGALITVVLKSVEIASKLRRNYKARNTYCQHGIKGGQTFDKCDICKVEKDNERIAFELKEKERQRKNIIQQKSTELRNQEIKRFTEINLKNKNLLYKLTPNQFEDVIARMYLKLGYEVEQTPYTNDRGKDIILKKNNVKYLVECKRYDFDNTIGREMLQKFFAAIVEEEAEKGFFVTTSDFKRTAIQYSKDIEKIELINGSQLSLIMRDLYPENHDSNLIKIMCEECGDIVDFIFKDNINSKLCVNGHSLINNFDKEVLLPGYLDNGRCCVKCGKPMKLVSYRNKKFWGCSNYPRCKSYQRFIQ